MLDFERFASGKHQNDAKNEHESCPDEAKVEWKDTFLVDCDLEKHIVEEHDEVGQIYK